ncbi:MAG: glycoside hydrolase [Actinomycetota bacterium]|nr:glycoside hydrolase [Actinomycetota bacterium]
MRKHITILLMAALLGTGVVLPAGARSGSAGKVFRSSGGVKWTPPVLVSTDQAHRETSIALSPTDPDLMFVCDPSGVPNTQHNQSYFHVSRDGGGDWEPLRVETSPDDLRNYAFEGGDCDVAFDEGGTMYSADTWLGNLSVGHSTDGGKTWAGTPLAGTSPIVDRPWLVGGPDGTIHVSYQDLQCCMPSAIWYTRSTDHGETFRPATLVASAGFDGAFTWEGNYVVSGNGNDLYLVYTRREAPLAANPPETVWVAASHDAGATWTSHLVAKRPTAASYLYASIAMDRAGYLHVVFASNTDTDVPIWYTVSKNQAKTWSKARPLTRGDAGYSPWIAAAGKGEAAIAWYGSPDPEADTQKEVDWYFYWARVAKGHTSKPRITSGTTTAAPIYTGRSDIPEFEMLRLDDDGRMHLGMSAFRVEPNNTRNWAIYYQSQAR